MEKVAQNLWIMRFPMKLAGLDIGRVVTLIATQSGELIVHSTAQFTPADVTEISRLRKTPTLVEATLFHDTYAASAQETFPNAPYYAPEGFAELTRTTTKSLATPPESWRGELEVLELEGMPKVREHVFFHIPSRTLIVADLVFNFGPEASPAVRFLFCWILGVRQFPGMSYFYRAMIRDRKAFANAAKRMMQWDFDRVIVGHGDVIETGGKEKLGTALARHGF